MQPFDHLVSALLEQQRYLEAKRLRCLEIYHQLVFGRRLHRQVGRLLTLEDAIDVIGRTSPIIESVKSVRQQAAEFGELTVRIDGGETVTSSQRYDFRAMDDQEGVRNHD